MDVRDPLTLAVALAPRSGIRLSALGAASLVLVALASGAVGFTAPALPGGSWLSIGPDGGDVHGLAFHPRDRDVVYASAGNGLYRSLDAGRTWVRFALHGEALDAVAVSPANPDLILVGTAEYCYSSCRLFRSQDGGQSWTPVALAGNVGWLTQVVLHPTDPRVAYLATAGGLRKSVDGGTTWQPVHGEPGGGFYSYSRLAMDPGHPDTLYIARSSRYPTPAAVLKSTDGGDSWAASSAGLDAGSYLDDMAIDPTDSASVFLAGDSGLFHSFDGGVTWTTVPVPSGFRRVVFAPSRPRTVYAAGSGLFASGDGGASWSLVGWPGEPGGTAVFMEDLVVDPDDSSLLLAALRRTGVYRSDDGAFSWSESDRGLVNTSVTALLATGSATVFAGTDSEGMFRSANGGTNWARANGELSYLPGGPDSCEFVVNGFAVDPSDGQSIDAATDCGVFRTADGGRDWTALGWVACANAILLDPGQAGVLFVAGSSAAYCYWGPGGILKSRDGGLSWVNVTQALGTLDVPTVIWDPWHPGVVLASATGMAPWQGGVLTSTDGGATWSWGAKVSGNANALLADPRTPGLLYLGTSSGAFRSVDGGASWTAVNMGLPCGDEPRGCPEVRAFVFDPQRAGTIYAATSAGVFASTDRGDHWGALNAGLANLDVRALALAATGKALLAGISGDGVFTLDLGVRHPRLRLRRASR